MELTPKFNNLDELAKFLDEQQKRLLALLPNSSDSIVVVPENDIKEHDEYDLNCECNPIIKYAGDKRIIIHQAFDGRHLIEEVNKLLGND